MAYLAGEPIVDTVYVEDVLGAGSVLSPATVFSSTFAYGPDNVPIAAAVSAGAVAGLYTVTIPTDANLPGTYTFLGISSETGVEYLGTWDVDPITQFTGQQGTTLADFRADLADLMRDHLRITATDDGSPTTWKDADNLTDSENAFMNSHLKVITAGNAANTGLIRRVRTSSGISNTITLEALPADVLAGDVGDLYNLGGHGFRPQFYDRSIAAAVKKSFPAALLNITTVGATPFDAALGTITIPADFVAVYGLQYDDGEFLRDVRPVTRTRGEFGSGWSVDTVARAFRVHGPWLDDMDGTAYTIFGYARHQAPNDDADIITLDETWLTYRAASMMANTRLTDARWNNWAIEWGRLEQGERGNIWTPRAPNTVWLQ